MGAELRAIAIALHWAEQCGIDLEERLGSVSLLLPEEIISLRDALREKVGGDRSELVNPTTYYSRVKYVTGYLVWRAQHFVSRIKNDDPRFLPARTRITEFKSSMVTGLGKIRARGREGLAPGVEERLRAVIHPEHAENPFQVKHRHRNHTLILIYIELGVRLSEALVIKGADLQLLGDNPTVTIHRRADDKDDPRLNPPLVKTNARILPLGQELCTALVDWVANVRSKKGAYPGAKKTPYVFVSRTGKPIALRTVGDQIRLLRTVPGLPDNLSAHILRHTWNDRFSALADVQGTTEADEIQQRNYLMGWNKNSQEGATYTQRHTRQRAHKASLALQKKSFGGENV